MGWSNRWGDGVEVFCPAAGFMLVRLWSYRSIGDDRRRRCEQAVHGVKEAFRRRGGGDGGVSGELASKGRRAGGF